MAVQMSYDLVNKTFARRSLVKIPVVGNFLYFSVLFCSVLPVSAWVLFWFPPTLQMPIIYSLNLPKNSVTFFFFFDLPRSPRSNHWWKICAVYFQQAALASLRLLKRATDNHLHLALPLLGWLGTIAFILRSNDFAVVMAPAPTNLFP